jgi:hypothetical protein
MRAEGFSPSLCFPPTPSFCLPPTPSVARNASRGVHTRTLVILYKYICILVILYKYICILVILYKYICILVILYKYSISILVIVLSRFLTHACQNPYPLNRGTGIGGYRYGSEIFTRGLPVLFTTPVPLHGHRVAFQKLRSRRPLRSESCPTSNIYLQWNRGALYSSPQ